MTTATLTTSGGNTTLKLSVTLTSALATKWLGKWAEYDWNHGYGDHGTEESPILFDDLTNQEKVNVILERVVELSKEEAKAQINDDSKVTADENAQADKDEIDTIS